MVRHAPLLALTALLLLSGKPGSAQSKRPQDLATGKILVTPRDSPDPHFAHSVILLAHYDGNGALGFMIQNRTDVAIRRALAGVSGAKTHPEPVYVGGPVDLSGVMALLRAPAVPKGAARVTGDLYLLPTRDALAAILSGKRDPSQLRVYAGYVGWSAGQLDHEVRLSAWYIFDYDESLIFDPHPETLWERLIARTETTIARSVFSGCTTTLQNLSNCNVAQALSPALTNDR
jgi:putative transcriptional regulator